MMRMSCSHPASSRWRPAATDAHTTRAPPRCWHRRCVCTAAAAWPNGGSSSSSGGGGGGGDGRPRPVAAAGVRVRRAEPADVPALAEIERLCAGASAQWSAADIEVCARVFVHGRAGFCVNTKKTASAVADDRRALRFILTHIHSPLQTPPQPRQAELSRDIARCFVVCDERAAPPGQPAPAPAPSPAGFAVGWLVAGELQVLELAVHPAARRRGLGGALLRALLAECGCYQGGGGGGDGGGEEGGAPATLEVRATNDGAVALYRRHGFEAVGRRRAYYADDGSDALLMARPPGPPPPREDGVGGGGEER